MTHLWPYLFYLVTQSAESYEKADIYGPCKDFVLFHILLKNYYSVLYLVASSSNENYTKLYN